MAPDGRKKLDPDYRPWSWIGGLILGAAIIAVMFGLSQSLG